MIYAQKPKDGNPILRYLRQPIYDRKQVAALATQTLYFFKDFTSVNPLITNMNTPGSLGSPNEFYLYGISQHVAASSKADITKYLESSYVTVRISNNDIFKSPAFFIPDSGPISGVVSTTASDTTLQSWYPGGNEKVLPVALDQNSPIKIGSMELFELSVNMTAAAAPDAAFYVWFFLHGIYGTN